MSGSEIFLPKLLSFLLYGLLGLAVTAAGLAGAAQLMAAQGYSGGAVLPLATAAVCAGSLLSALAAAFRKKERGLLTGLLQSIFLAAPLALSAERNRSGNHIALPCPGRTVLRQRRRSIGGHPAGPSSCVALIVCENEPFCNRNDPEGKRVCGSMNKPNRKTNWHWCRS